MEGKPTSQQCIDRLLRHPENWELRLAAAAALSAEGRPGEAVTVLDSAPSPPDSEPELLQCAEIYAQTQPVKAVELLHGWLTMFPNAAVVHLAMADTALRLGDNRGAQAYYERAIQIQPEYRDPDLEIRYGVAVPPVPIATRPVAAPAPAPTSPLPAANPVPTPVATEPPAEAKAPSARTKAPTGSPIGPLVTAATAVGVFLVGWLIVALVLRTMLAHS